MYVGIYLFFLGPLRNPRGEHAGDFSRLADSQASLSFRDPPWKTKAPIQWQNHWAKVRHFGAEGPKYASIRHGQKHSHKLSGYSLATVVRKRPSWPLPIRVCVGRSTDFSASSSKTFGMELLAKNRDGRLDALARHVSIAEMNAAWTTSLLAGAK